MAGVRGALGALAAALALGLAADPAAAEPRALTPWDAQLYAAAFDAVKRGDFAEADRQLARINDRCLAGMVEFNKLFHRDYRSSYAELAAWLEKYGDLPPAARVRALARRKKAELDAASVQPAAEPPPGQRNPVAAVAAVPGQVAGRTWDAVEAAGRLIAPSQPEDIPAKAAREALNEGRLSQAYDLALQLGDQWIAGLASWRRGRYDEAFRRFEMVALDVSEDGWVRSGGAFWAARAAMAKGSPELAPEYLRIAARWPYTFYGILAERQLGLEPSVRPGPQLYAPGPGVARAVADGLDAPGMVAFVRANPRAKRATALAQLGMRAEAGMELRAGLAEARDETSRGQWTKLALGLDANLSARQSPTVDLAAYPAPELGYNGQYTVDRALLYALMRRESRFSPTARSSVGAYGLMQVMPQTAAWLTGDSSLRTNPDRLFDPQTNMRVGQAYIGYLAGQSFIDNDVFRIVAAYNGGPQPVMVTHQRLPKDADVLLFMESIPVPQTRVYVEEVMAAYWIYRAMFGLETPSLDAVARGVSRVPLSMDYRPPAPVAAPAPAGPPPAVPAAPASAGEPARTGAN